LHTVSLSLYETLKRLAFYLTKDVRAFAIIKGIFNLKKMENLETLVTIITAQNKTIKILENRLKTAKESSTFWYTKFKELEESLTPKKEA
jgi:hypothetical protein